MQQHKHNNLYLDGNASFEIGGSGGGSSKPRGINLTATQNGYILATGNAGGGNSENLQPYITSYKWKRTA